MSPRVEVLGRVRLVTFDRPEVLNAFDVAQFDAVGDVLEAAAADDAVGAVVLTGAGRAFTAGLDLRDQSVAGDGRGFEHFIAQLEAFPKPVVAAVNGVAVGVGVTMLIHCDVVVVARTARLRLPFTELGLTAEAGSSVTLAWAVGQQHASRLLLTAAWFDGDEAENLGLAWRAVPEDQVVPRALAEAQAMAELPLRAVVATKRLLVAARIDAVRAARARERTAMAELAGSPENMAALAAFRDRRGRA